MSEENDKKQAKTTWLDNHLNNFEAQIQEINRQIEYWKYNIPKKDLIVIK